MFDHRWFLQNKVTIAQAAELVVGEEPESATTGYGSGPVHDGPDGPKTKRASLIRQMLRDSFTRDDGRGVRERNLDPVTQRQVAEALRDTNWQASWPARVEELPGLRENALAVIRLTGEWLAPLDLHSVLRAALKTGDADRVATQYVSALLAGRLKVVDDGSRAVRLDVHSKSGESLMNVDDVCKALTCFGLPVAVVQSRDWMTPEGPTPRHESFSVSPQNSLLQPGRSSCTFT